MLLLTAGAAVNLNSIKTLLANGLTLFFINGKRTFINGPRSLLGSSSDCVVFDLKVFDNFLSADKLSAKA